MWTSSGLVVVLLILHYALSLSHTSGGSQNEEKLAYYALSLSQPRGGSQDEEKFAYYAYALFFAHARRGSQDEEKLLTTARSPLPSLTRWT